MIWVDITSFFQFIRRSHTEKISFTGINRVIFQYTIELLERDDVYFCAFSSILGSFCIIDKVMLQNLRDSILFGSTALTQSQIYILKMIKRRKLKDRFFSLFTKKFDLSLVKFNPDDILLDMGGNFGDLSKFYITQKVKKSTGIKYGLLIHDILCYTNPELFGKDHSKKFKSYILQAIKVSNFILTSSNFTKLQLNKYLLKDNSVRLINIKFGSNIKPLDSICPEGGFKYILCVGTIEIRKNHINLLKGWHKVISQNKTGGVKLVIAGNWGWKVEEFTSYIKQYKSDLDGHVIIKNNVCDSEMSCLYKNCLFTVFASVAEGFGLPIVESFSYGKLCVASNASCIPEVGGNLAEYFDPMNVDDIANKLSFFIQNNQELLKKENTIKLSKITTWKEASEDLIFQLKTNLNLS